MTAKPDNLALPSQTRGLHICFEEIFLCTSRASMFSEPHPSFQSYLQQILKKQKNVIDWDTVNLDLSKSLCQLAFKNSLNLDAVHPAYLLQLFNQYLSPIFIYDLNQQLCDKPHTTLSMQTIGYILGFTRNQLNYRQAQIEKTYQQRMQQLTEKCPALANGDITLIWRVENEYA